jgi:hypothetical protein
MSAKTRLKRLERKANSGVFVDVLAWVRAGRFYDELTEAEQVRYCQYRYGDEHTEPPEQYLSTVFPGMQFDPHFQLEYKPKPPTEKEFRENVAFIQEYMQKRQDEYNSPEAQEQRKREYEELQEIGRKRREAFYAGIPMDTYPLPWDKKGSADNE